MSSAQRPIPGLSRRRQAFYLTVVKPTDLPVNGDMFETVVGVHANAAAHAEALQWCLAAGNFDPFIMACCSS